MYLCCIYVGDRMKEAQCINRSLSALGDVISALSRMPKKFYGDFSVLFSVADGVVVHVNSDRI